MTNEHSIAFIENRLRDLPKEIYDASTKCINAKEIWLKAKAEYINKQAMIKLVAKAEDSKITQSDLTAKATSETHGLHLELIVTEATYQKAVAQRQLLDDEFVSLRKVASLRQIIGVQ